MVKNKRGWVKIVEAVTALLLIAAFLLFVIDQRENSSEDLVFEEIFLVQESVLKKIQLNDSLREDILAVSSNVSTRETGFPSEVNESIQEEIPEYLDCEAKICNITSSEEISCNIQEVGGVINENIYVQSLLIMSNYNVYDPKQLSLFCWRK